MLVSKTIVPGSLPGGSAKLLNIYTMSRSIKLPIIKDKYDYNYNKVIRSRVNNIIRMMKYNPELEIPYPHSIINPYDVCDWIYRIEPHHSEYIKSQRK